MDWSKPVQTRDGRAVRVLCTDRKSGHRPPILGLVATREGDEIAWAWDLGGVSTGKDRAYDLINVPQRHVHADLIIAWANGAAIEARIPDGSWAWSSHPAWRPDNEYRIASF